MLLKSERRYSMDNKLKSATLNSWMTISFIKSMEHFNSKMKDPSEIDDLLFAKVEDRGDWTFRVAIQTSHISAEYIWELEIPKAWELKSLNFKTYRNGNI